MLRDSPEVEGGALRQFVERFRDDAGFRDLVRVDVHAALSQIGIIVPCGVNIDFASDAATALSMTLDHSARPSDEARVLDDDELQVVAGGTNRNADFDEIADFLRIFRHTGA